MGGRYQLAAVLLAGCGSFDLELKLPPTILDGTEIVVDGEAVWETPVWRGYDSYDAYADAPLVLEIRYQGATTDRRLLDLTREVAYCSNPDRASLYIAISPGMQWWISSGSVTSDAGTCVFAARPAPTR